MLASDSADCGCSGCRAGCQGPAEAGVSSATSRCRSGSVTLCGVLSSTRVTVGRKETDQAWPFLELWLGFGSS